MALNSVAGPIGAGSLVTYSNGQVPAPGRFPVTKGLYVLQGYVPQFGPRIINAFDIDAWKRASTLLTFSVRLIVRHGDVTVRLRNHTIDAPPNDLFRFEQKGTGSLYSPTLKLGDLSGALLPVIEHCSPDANYEIRFVTDDQPVNPHTKINYVFCTFKRAEYVQANAHVFRDYMRRASEQSAAHLTVIDNGSIDGAVDCGVVEDKYVSVYTNNNTGGAGGFGRGVYETVFGALADKAFTHVCLLDDDIYLHPEMFARNTAFTKFLKPNFHLGAPMYPTSSENKVPRMSACFGHKFCGTVNPSDQSLGSGLDTSDLEAFLRMDRQPDSTGWWWSCFAISDVLKIGLPYPFFIKMDDVEYSLRLQQAGVELMIPYSFWVLHDDFEEKYSAAMQYFRHRNRWVLLCQLDRLDPNSFLADYSNQVRNFIEARKYEHAVLMLDAMDHFLEGPEHLVSHEKTILKGVFARVKNEKNIKFDEPPPHVSLGNNLEGPSSERSARLTAKTFNNHFLPHKGLQEHVVIDTTRANHVRDVRRAKKVTYWNSVKNVGFTVERNSQTAAQLIWRLRGHQAKVAQSLPQLVARYRSVKPYLTSAEFWSGYGKFNHRPALAPSAHSTILQDTAVQTARLRSMLVQAQAINDGYATDVSPQDTATLNSLRNRYLGKRCFVLGNGPSLTVSDLNLLRGEVTFAANKIYLIYDQTDWRPTFYSVEDLLVAQNNTPEIMALEGSTKIFPHHMLKFLPRQPNHIYTRWLPPADNRSPFREFSTDLAKGVCWGSTITYSMLQMAVHMGFREIYILGLDHSYIEPATKEGNALVSQGERNHFHPDYRKPGEKWHLPVLDRLETSYGFAHEFCQNIGVNIYNASRFSKLEAFPRVNLDDVLRKDSPS